MQKTKIKIKCKVCGKTTAKYAYVAMLQREGIEKYAINDYSFQKCLSCDNKEYEGTYENIEFKAKSWEKAIDKVKNLKIAVRI